LIEMNGSFEYYHHLQLADPLKYILKDIFIYTIKNNVVINENIHEKDRMTAKIL
jgi:hypothetical protein